MAAVVNDKIVVTGGQADGKLVKETEILPGGVEWLEGADLPTPREHLAAASDGRFLYTVGGRELGADRNTRAFERYDVVDDKLDEACEHAGRERQLRRGDPQGPPHRGRWRGLDAGSSRPCSPTP